jgi:hypothetical protein
MSCDDKKYLIDQIIVKGESLVGPPGPPGPPGALPDTYPADQVTVTNVGFNNVQEVLDALLYVPVNITSFTTGTKTFETGRQLTSLTFTWAINKDVVSQTLTGPPEMTPVVLTPEQRAITVTLANLGSDATFTLQVNDGTQPDSSNVSISFVTANYQGDALIPGVIDDAFIKSLSSKVLDANRLTSYTSDAVGSQHNWYVYPTRHGVATFFAGGFEGGYSNVAVVNFTNDYGFTEDVYVWRSDNPDIGPGINIDVI